MAPRRKTKASNGQKETKQRKDQAGDDEVWNEITNEVESQKKYYHGPLPWSEFAIIAIVTFVAYYPVFSAGFVWDDFIFVNAPQVLKWRGIFDIWFKPGTIRNEVHYWPVVYSSFWLEYHIWGLSPLGFHVTNVLLHIVNACLIQRLLQRFISPRASWLAALIFAVHPVHVESVAWIIEHKDTLSGIFYLSALLYHPSMEPESSAISSNDSRRRVIISLVFYVLGMWTKSIVVSLPAILCLVPWMLRGHVTWDEIGLSSPFFAAGILLALFDMDLTKGKDNVNFGLSLIERVLIASRGVCFYASKLVWPTNLIMIYPRWDFDGDVALWALCLIAGPAAFFTLYALRDSLGRGPVAALLFFVLTLSPTLGFIDYSYMQYTFVADRYQYLAVIGPIAAFAVLCVHIYNHQDTRIQRFSALIVAFVGIVLALLASGTWQQCHAYYDDISFFGHVTEQNPTGFHGWYHLGNEYLKRGNSTEAIRCYEAAFPLQTDEPRLEHIRKVQDRVILKNYGVALSKLGKYDESIEPLKRALEIDPRSTKVLNTLGKAMTETKNEVEALTYFHRTTQVDPRDFSGWAATGSVLARLGRFEEATEFLEQAIKLKPTVVSVSVRLNLAYVYENLQRHDDSIAQLREILVQDPNNGEAKKRLEKAMSNVNQ